MACASHGAQLRVVAAALEATLRKRLPSPIKSGGASMCRAKL